MYEVFEFGARILNQDLFISRHMPAQVLNDWERFLIL